MEESTMMMSVAYGIGALVHFALSVAFLVVGSTTVRRASSSAGWLVSLSAGVSVVAQCTGMVGPVVLARGAVEDLMRWNVISALLGVLFSMASGGAMISALVQLASRPGGTGVRGD